ncbi:MAG: hypothetical protein ACI9LN_004359, partial [Saprospiraceae bacterium]
MSKKELAKQPPKTLYNQHFPFLKILSQKQAFYRHLFQKIYKLSKTVIFINSQK